ncbi:MAG: long-chain fatty acid--CoA ligase [Alphaproteobacteria bacterium]|nr:long-chain fatty acid--CoA ligase [Alphaproteobacteria bacterium]
MTEATLERPWINSYPEGIKWDAPIEAFPVYKMLDQTAAKHPDAPAFDFLGAKMTWSEVNEASKKFAKGLQDLGVKKGDKVGIMLPNCPLFVIAYYAAMRIGATAVNYNPLDAEEKIAKSIENSETDLMITTDLEMIYNKVSPMLYKTRLNNIVVGDFCDMLPFTKNWLFRIFKSKERVNVQPTKRIHLYQDLIRNNGQYKEVNIDPKEDIALYQFTGGTTGTPKAAMLTHANIAANTQQAAMWFHNAEEGKEKVAGVLPFFHVFAMTAVMNLSVYKAFEIIMMPRFELDGALKLINDKKPTVLPAVPTIYSKMNNHKPPYRLTIPSFSIGKWKIPAIRLGQYKYDLSHLKYGIAGGASLPVEVKKQFEQLTGSTIVEGYGLSESSPVLCCNPVEGENKPGSIGLPVPQTNIKLIDEHNKVVGIGERGELCAKGPQVMKGYFSSPKETENTLRNGWLHTGDIAIMDEEGHFFIVDRKKDMIISGGYNIYPKDVEDALYQHPSVEECIVAGLPHDDYGETVTAWIKFKDDREAPTISDLKSFLKTKLVDYQLPRIFKIQDELPKTMIGKLDKKTAREQEIAKQQAQKTPKP